LTRGTRERLDVDTEASRRLDRREQLPGRSLVCVEVRTQTRCQDAQLLVGEIGEDSSGERGQHAGSGLLAGWLAGGHEERTSVTASALSTSKRRGVQKEAPPA
jgi:hypothetical protein